MTKKATMDDSHFLSEQLLIQDLRKMENKAFKYLYQKYFPIVSSVLIKIGAREDEVDDIFQETLLSLTHSINKPSFELKYSLSGLICRIAKFIFYSKSKKDSKTVGPEHISDPGFNDQEEAEKEQESRDLEEKLRKAIGQLPKDRRELILDYYFENLSYEKIVEKRRPELFNPRNEPEIKRLTNNLRNQAWNIIQRLKNDLL